MWILQINRAIEALLKPIFVGVLFYIGVVGLQGFDLALTGAISGNVFRCG